MTDSTVQLQPDSTGKFCDTTSLTVSAQTVQRQRMVIAGAAAADLAPVDVTLGLATAVRDISVSMRQMVQQINRPMAVDPATGRIRQSLENIAAGVTLATVTTVGTVSSVTSIGTLSTVTTVTNVTTVGTVNTVTTLSQLRGFDIKDTSMNVWDRTLWGQNIRPRISG